MINATFSDYDYQLLPKRQEQFEKYCKIIQWGRQHPTHFIEDFFKIQLSDHQKWILMNSWLSDQVVWLCSRATGKSFMAAIFLMTRTILFPNTNAYIMGPSGGQSAETFMKLESIATQNIASLVGTSTVFIDECKRMNAKASPFTHDKSGYSVTLNNGSTINSLNSVAKNLVGIRSALNVFDEAGKIDRNFYSLTLPFTAQNMDFVTGSGINDEIYPRQMQNKNLFLSSAEGVDSYLFDMYKLCFNKMLLGDTSYFVCDIDCNFSLHPFINGKPAHPLLQQKTVDDAMATNPYRATREYYNRFDSDNSESCYIKRSTIIKYSETYYPTFQNVDNKKYIIAYDPSSKLDNSIISVFEMFRDEEKGLMLRLVNCANLIELLPSGDKAVIQKPEQIEILKKMMLDYNQGALDYDNLELVAIDAGSGGLKPKPPYIVICIKKHIELLENL